MSEKLRKAILTGSGTLGGLPLDARRPMIQAAASCRTPDQLGSVLFLALRNAYNFIVQASDVIAILIGRLYKSECNSLANEGKRVF